MFVTSDEQRGGLLVAVISGGRPKLKERPTARFLADLAGSGVAGITWVVAEKDADDYERDQHDLTVYSDEWAEEYADTHWLRPTPYERGTFYGAFVGREAACLEAEKRGCWGVLQLDDNIIALLMLRQTTTGAAMIGRNGGLALFVDHLAAVALSTNGRMVGAQLSAVTPSIEPASRPGFPYSCFVEKVGEGREHWVGPFEDDITHAFQYGTRADNATALVVSHLQYRKESKSKSGMRSAYNHERSVQLQRCFPESAKLVIKSTKANGITGDDTARVFHQMKAGAIRNPQTITDHDLYGRYKKRVEEMHREFASLMHQHTADKIRKRCAKAGIAMPGEG